MTARNTIELDLECYKALESHRQSLDESALDILRRILLSANDTYKECPAEPAERSAPARGDEGSIGGGAPDRTSPTLSPDHMSPTLPPDRTGPTLSPDHITSALPRDHITSALPPDHLASALPPDWQDPNDETERRTGNYLVQLGDKACFASSQKAAYRLGLIWLEKTRPGLLAALAHAGTRNRRIVAHSPDALYPRSPALAKHAEKLIDDWYVDVNLSKEQKLSRLKTACRHAGLMFGKDLIVDL
ncbi:hypothetical protein [Maricaulis sp.]|uniref:hypothetical protein n=1 Tax=Maricaulis sp. TaxID=1486257 RepID=UPI003299614E